MDALGHDDAQRLRIAVGRLARRLRLIDSGSTAGMTPARASALLAVERRGPMRLTDLAVSEGVNPTMLSRMVADLTESGLMLRSCDPGDRRVAWVEVTDAGRDLALEMRSRRTAAMANALDALDGRQRRRVVEALPALEALVAELPDPTDRGGDALQERS